MQQCFKLLRQRPKTVSQLLPRLLQISKELEPCKPPIDLQADIGLWDEVGRHVRRKIEDNLRHPIVKDLFATCASQRSLQNVAISLRADQEHVPRLLLPQQIARAPLIQIGNTDLEAGAEAVQLTKLCSRFCAACAGA